MDLQTRGWKHKCFEESKAYIGYRDFISFRGGLQHMQASEGYVNRNVK